MIFSGTRYKRRGVDTDGHVANYVESEQILLYHHYALSYLQVSLKHFAKYFSKLTNYDLFFRFEVLYHYTGLNQESSTDLQRGWMQLQKKTK